LALRASIDVVLNVLVTVIIFLKPLYMAVEEAVLAIVGQKGKVGDLQEREVVGVELVVITPAHVSTDL
jgi:hypothetical protein